MLSDMTVCAMQRRSVSTGRELAIPYLVQL